MMRNNDTFLKFKKLLNFVFENKHSIFYRLKYKRTNFNPDKDFNSINDVKKIPLLNKEELDREDPFKLLFIPEEEIEVVSPTSGTTTGNPFVAFFSKNILGPPKIAKVSYKKTLILMNPFRAPLLNLAYKQIKNVPLVGDIHNLPTSCQLASKLGIDHVYTTPTLAIMLKKYLVNYPDFQKNFRYLSIGGEIISREKRKLLRKLYPDKEILIEYGMSEVGGVPAAQCSALAQREEVLFHTRTDDCYFEIINPATEEEVSFGAQGELVLTNFQSLAIPLIRYKTGDMASFRENDCTCGKLGPLLTIHGRINYDTVRVGGFELRRQMLEKPLSNLSSFLEDEFEVHIYETLVENKPRIKIILNLSLKEGFKESPGLKQKIENELLENWQLSSRLNLRKAVEVGMFEPLQINLSKFPRSIKTKQLLILH